MKIFLAICLDVDRDAPFPKKGVSHGISLPLHQESINVWRDPSKFLLNGTIQGITQLISMFQENEWPATFFFEAGILNELTEAVPQLSEYIEGRTSDIGLHGLYHEDLTGEETGIILSKTQEAQMIVTAVTCFLDIFDRQPIGFRAPYLRLSPHTHEILVDQGFLYDSSQVITTSTVPQIFTLPMVQGTLYEVPILRYPLKSPPFMSYFWSLFESSRSADEIIKILTSVIKRSPAGNEASSLPYVLTLNLHPWHLAFSIKEKRYFTKDESLIQTKNLCSILKTLEEMEITEFITLTDVIPP